MTRIALGFNRSIPGTSEDEIVVAFPTGEGASDWPVWMRHFDKLADCIGSSGASNPSPPLIFKIDH